VAEGVGEKDEEDDRVLAALLAMEVPDVRVVEKEVAGSVVEIALSLVGVGLALSVELLDDVTLSVIAALVIVLVALCIAVVEVVVSILVVVLALGFAELAVTVLDMTVLVTALSVPTTGSVVPITAIEDASPFPGDPMIIPPTFPESSTVALPGGIMTACPP
jgi:hypothetical protein